MAYDFRKMFEGEVEGDESLNGVEDVYRLYKCWLFKKLKGGSQAPIQLKEIGE